MGFKTKHTTSYTAGTKNTTNWLSEIFLLLEDGAFLLQENMSFIALETEQEVGAGKHTVSWSAQTKH